MVGDSARRRRQTGATGLALTVGLLLGLVASLTSGETPAFAMTVRDLDALIEEHRLDNGASLLWVLLRDAEAREPSVLERALAARRGEDIAPSRDEAADDEADTDPTDSEAEVDEGPPEGPEDESSDADSDAAADDEAGEVTGDAGEGRPSRASVMPIGGWPDRASTGVPDDVELTPSGPITVEQSDATIEGREVSGEVVIAADNVTVRRSRILTEGASAGIRIEPGRSGTLIEDVEIDGTDGGCDVGIGFANYTAVRVDVHGCEQSVHAGDNTSVESSYLHDQRGEVDDQRAAVASTGGSNIRVVRSTLEGPPSEPSAAVLLQSASSAVTDVRIVGNKLSGGNHALALRDGDYGKPLSVTVRENYFVAGSWRYEATDLDEGEGFWFEGNVGHDD